MQKAGRNPVGPGLVAGGLRPQGGPDGADADDGADDDDGDNDAKLPGQKWRRIELGEAGGLGGAGRRGEMRAAVTGPRRGMGRTSPAAPGGQGAVRAGP